MVKDNSSMEKTFFNSMDPRFLTHNSHLSSLRDFSIRDPQLCRLKSQPYVFQSGLIDSFPSTIPGIYTLGGGRQIGKTTLLKQWMKRLLDQGVAPETILFLSGELIDDHHAFLHQIQFHLSLMPKDQLIFILVDEITDIREWDKAVKYAADSGIFDQVVLMITGSDLSMLNQARMRFPGRRGIATQVDFHLLPLSFREFVLLKDPNQLPSIDDLFQHFNNYLIHGGYLTAINDLARNGSISFATLTTYSDWIRGDMLKRGKQEYVLKSLLEAILKCYGSQISWNSLSQHLPLDHPQTVANYVELLESMDALFIQSALREDLLKAAPKKAKKLYFKDPFIFHGIQNWIFPSTDPFHAQILADISNHVIASQLAETCAVTHYHRYYPTYYIKGDGEVDIAYVKDKKFWPVEVKWTNQLRTQDLKQILKYPWGKILTQVKTTGTIEGISTVPLPMALFEL
jgi:predicted AAA+ superfamily ATPase